jgi:hypothetical protein
VSSLCVKITGQPRYPNIMNTFHLLLMDNELALTV